MPLSLVFDLDGTLVDSLPDLLDAANQLLAEEGRRSLTAGECRAMIGEGAAVLVARAFEATGPAAQDDVLKALTRRYLVRYEAAPAGRTRLFPNVADVLAALHRGGHAIGLCTNKPDATSRRLIGALGIARFFDVVVGGDAVASRKPDGAHVHAVLEGLGADPGEAVMIGDSPIYMAAARGAGVRAVAVSYGYSRVPAAELDADVLIDDFAELPAVLCDLARA